MKKNLYLILFVVLASKSFAQDNFSMEYGKVTQYEMGMKEYNKDKNAEALVIYDIGNYFFQGHDREGFLLHMKRKTKIKILKSSGIDYANIEIPYYTEGNRWENIYDIKAVTYNLDNGQLIKTVFDEKKMYEEKVSENWTSAAAGVRFFAFGGKWA